MKRLKIIQRARKEILTLVIYLDKFLKIQKLYKKTFGIRNDS